MFDLHTLTLAFAALEWTLRVVMLPILVIRKREPATCLAWLAIVSFEPVIGTVVYLLIGEIRLGRRTRRKRRRQAEGREFSAADPPEQFVVRLDNIPREGRALLELAESLGDFELVSGNHVTFLSETGEFIDQVVADIESAQDHVHLLFYIFGVDAVGGRVGEALIRAAKRGVKCRVLLDAVGSKRALRRLGHRLRREGVEVVATLPANWLRRPFARLDIRNHRKLMVVDGRVAMTGSQNIVEATYGRTGPNVRPWHDAMARLTGPAVQQLQEVFLEDWFHETGEVVEDEGYYPPCEAQGDAIVQVVPTGPDLPTQAFQDMIVTAILMARRRVVITTPYFIPDAAMLTAIRMAVHRGVEFDLIMPEKSDQILPGLAGKFYYEQVTQLGGNVFLFPELLHTKTLTVDEDLAIFGSANYDMRSFHLNFEINLLLHPRSVVEKVLRMQEDYLAKSRMAGPEDMPNRRWHIRLAVNLAKLFSPLL